MNEKLESILQEGRENLQIVTDFDRTLIRGIVEGQEVPSATHMLYTEKHLDDDYMSRAKALYDEYRPIEQDRTISQDEKSAKMHEWWSRHYALKLEKGLHIDHIKNLSNSEKLVFRPGVQQLFTTCKEKSIPIIILSSNGIGYDIIHMLLEREGIMSDNVHIYSNRTLWGDDGVTRGVAEPIIHSQNKNETVLREHDLRKNFIVIGDGLSDALMIEKREGRGLYTIGVYEASDEERLPAYKNAFDEVWSSLDGGIDFSVLTDHLSRSL